MKRLTAISLALIIFTLFFCNSSEKTVYKKGSQEYEFLTSTADSLNLPVLSPENNVTLITTTEFTIRNLDIMPELYSTFYNYKDRIQNLPAEHLKSLVQRIADQTAANKMFLAAAEEKDITIDESDIEVEMERIAEKYGGKENFKTALDKNNIAEEQFREDVKSSLIVRTYISDYYYNNVSVPEEAIKKWYNNTFATVRHILLMTQDKSEEEKEKIHTKMEQILKEAKSGKDFAKLAEKYSEDPGSKDKGGLYEHFPRGQMVKPFEEAAFNIPVGSISDIVTTQYGYHIIKVIDRTQDPRPYEEAKKEIHSQLAQQKNPNIYPQIVDSLKQSYSYEMVYNQ